jgi:hypothetical protein
MTIKQQSEIDRAEFAVMVRRWVHSGIGSVAGLANAAGLTVRTVRRVCAGTYRMTAYVCAMLLAAMGRIECNYLGRVKNEY